MLDSKKDNTRTIDELNFKHAKELQKAIADAKAQALIEHQVSPETSTKTQEALTALEARLKEEHKKELDNLKAALEQARQKPIEDTSVSQLAQADAQLSNLRGEIEALSKAKEDAHAQGIEQGRQEMSMKIKLKDG